MNEEEEEYVGSKGKANRVAVSRAARITRSLYQFLSQGEIHLGGHWGDDWLPGVAISCSSRDGALPCIVTTNGYELWSTYAAAVSQTTDFDRGEDLAAGVAGILDWPRMRRKEKNKNGSMENSSKFSEGEERRKRGERGDWAAIHFGIHSLGNSSIMR
ncbi:hypothetical protein ASPTUDRAFT_58102 [Aspergillus tubingensis CBS 134.48]|uniref:Uncharacterized protein n=1 Tax=Aspergillus tubingensis (strain CBS 134.48) TaxID=767770 RepID=A0A1L9MZG7_ASPTC|nr:hypothetical protein ASPTUDRAFT_58102 [Aspergillus tubingensis CBS 134.48]